MENKVVLAFSGGLDTSYCVKFLTQEKGMEVHSILVNTGGFDEQELSKIEAQAYDLGVTSHKCQESTELFYTNCVKYLIFGNVLRNNTYPLSVSAERVFQAMAVAEHARGLQASHIAHGSTGAGNDQVRFDLVFEIMCPEIKIITPIRDQQLSRKQEIDYLQKHGVDWDWTKGVGLGSSEGEIVSTSGAAGTCQLQLGQGTTARSESAMTTARHSAGSGERSGLGFRSNR